jgi:hypothetical protein
VAVVPRPSQKSPSELGVTIALVHSTCVPWVHSGDFSDLVKLSLSPELHPSILRYICCQKWGPEGSEMSTTHGYEEPRKVHKSIVLDLQQLSDSLENAVAMSARATVSSIRRRSKKIGIPTTATNCWNISASTVEPCVTAKHCASSRRCMSNHIQVCFMCQSRAHRISRYLSNNIQVCFTYRRRAHRSHRCANNRCCTTNQIQVWSASRSHHNSRFMSDHLQVSSTPTCQEQTHRSSRLLSYRLHVSSLCQEWTHQHRRCTSNQPQVWFTCRS